MKAENMRDGSENAATISLSTALCCSCTTRERKINDIHTHPFVFASSRPIASH